MGRFRLHTPRRGENSREKRSLDNERIGDDRRNPRRNITSIPGPRRLPAWPQRRRPDSIEGRKQCATVDEATGAPPPPLTEPIPPPDRRCRAAFGPLEKLGAAWAGPRATPGKTRPPREGEGPLRYRTTPPRGDEAHTSSLLGGGGNEP